jgi:outer membrane protein TolC
VFDLSLENSSFFSRGSDEHQYTESWLSQYTPLWGTTLKAGWRKGDGSFPAYDKYLLTGSQGEWFAKAIVPLLKNGAVDPQRFELNYSELDQKFTAQLLILKRLEFQRDAKRGYWKWLLAGHKWKIQNDLLDIAKQRQRALLKKLEAGALAEVDVADNELMITQRENILASTMGDFQNASAELAPWLMQPPNLVMESWCHPPAIHDFKPHIESHSSLLEKSVNQYNPMIHPLLLSLQIRQQQAEAKWKLAKNQILPTLNAYGGASRDEGTRLPSQSEKVEAGIQFSYPLQNREARAQRRIAINERKKADLDLSLEKTQLETKWQQTMNLLNATSQQMTLARREVELAIRLNQAEVQKWELGDSNLLFVNMREQFVASAKLKLVEAQAKYLIAWAEADFLNPR